MDWLVEGYSRDVTRTCKGEALRRRVGSKYQGEQVGEQVRVYAIVLDSLLESV